MYKLKNIFQEITEVNHQLDENNVCLFHENVKRNECVFELKYK